MWALVTYSYYFEIVSTVSFYCDLSSSVEVCMFLFNNVILYYKQGIILAASDF